MKGNNVRFGIMLSIVGFIISLVDLTGNIALNAIILVISSIVLLTAFSSVGAYIQIFSMSLVTFYTTYSDPYKSTTILQLLLVFILLKKNGFLDRFFLKKILYIVSLFLIVLVISLTVNNRSIFRFIPYFLLGAFLFISAFILYRKEIYMFVNNEKILKSELKSLNNKLEDTYENLKSLEGSYINPVNAGLTKTELALLEDLCIYRDSNTDIGKRLEKSQHTVKIQLGNIMSKVGAKSRYELISMCRGFFKL